MAVADQPSGLMDIASSLTQDEIPFKLRCAICNKLAVNAFRLPCCDQAICENCQASLPETCPVCAHTPISPELCKPNKALRTTLKAFLRTEEKKREKERPSAAVIPTVATPVDSTPAPQETPATAIGPEDTAVQDTLEAGPDVPEKAEDPSVDAAAAEADTANVPKVGHDGPTDVQPETAQAHGAPADAIEGADDVQQGAPAGGDGATDAEQSHDAQQSTTQVPGSGQMYPNGVGFDMTSGGMPNMVWGGNPMAQFMSNGMFNLQNPMGMPGMGMDPMAATQGMFGGYGMNMNGMSNGMNVGMGFDAGQGMYGGWDGSQNNMWNGGQDKFNPNAFANGMGPQFGGPSGFGGFNVSQPNGNYAPMQQQQQFPSSDFQNGYYGAGYGRGNFRGRGRGFGPGGRGRGGFSGHMQANYPPNANYAGYQSHGFSSMNEEMPPQDGVTSEMSANDPSAAESKKFHDELAPGGEQEFAETSAKETTDEKTAAMDESAEVKPADAPSTDDVPAEEPQLRGIPTIETIDQAAHAVQPMHGGPMGMPGSMGPGFGRGGFMRGPFQGGRGGGFPGASFMPGNQQDMFMEPRGQGVEGAPAAPRAMRQGLPNTSVLRQRGFQTQGRGSIPPTRLGDVSQSGTPAPAPDESQARSRSRSKSRAKSQSRSRTRSPSPSRQTTADDRRRRQRSQSVMDSADDREGRRDRQKRRSRHEGQDDEATPIEENARSRSGSPESSRMSSRRQRDRDRRSARRSHRSERHRSRTRSPSRNGDGRHLDRISEGPEDNGIDSRDKVSVSGEALDSSSRMRSGKDRSSRRDEDKERDRENRRRDRARDREGERDRDRDRHRDRDRERDRHRDRDRERERDRERDRDRDRERDRERDRDRRDRDRKRSRRDRSESPAGSEYSSRHHSRRIKRGRDDEVRNGDKDRRSSMDRNRSTKEPEKDAHTLEREARNRERLLKEQQRREAAKSGRKRDSRGERALSGGRRLSYKYEDEESDDARATRVEREREASRWA